MQVGEVFDPKRPGNLNAVKVLSVGQKTVRFEPLSGKDKGKPIKVGVDRFRHWYAPRPVRERLEPPSTNGHIKLVPALPTTPAKPKPPEAPQPPKPAAKIDAVPMLVTPELAMTWLTMTPYQGQRAVRQHRVAELAQEMIQGRFRLSTIDIRRVGDGDSTKRYLINGQHRLRAIVESGVAQMMVVVESEADSMDDVAADYATVDRPLVRSYLDAMTAYGLGDELGLTKTQVSKLQSAAQTIACGFMAGTRSEYMRSPIDRVEFVRDWARPAMHAFATIGEAKWPRIKRLYTAPVFAVVLVTFRYRPDAAEAFWGRIAEHNGLVHGDPAFTFSEHLVAATVISANYPKLQRGTALAWNAAAEGRELRLIRVLDQTAPIRIAGTPYDGRQHLTLADLQGRTS